MLNVRNATLNVAAVIVIVAGLLSLLTTLPKTLLGLGAAPASQATAAPTSAAAATEISATAATTPTVTPIPPRAGPNPLVIRGDKGPLFPLFQTYLNDVRYSTASLVVWSIDPTTLAPTDTITNFVVSWQPATSADNVLPLDVQRDSSGCQALKFPDAQHSPTCYTVSVTRATTMSPGIYTSTLYISDNAGTESAVTVKVLIGRSLWVLLIAVSLGVIVTEAWLLWRKTGQYDLGWAYRRRVWLNGLSKNLTWTRPFEQSANAQQAERDALQIVKTELRTATNAVSTWLEQGRTGIIALQDLPASDDAIQAKIDPLSTIAQRYLVSPHPMEQSLTDLSAALTELRAKVVPAVNDYLKASIDLLNGFYQANLSIVRTQYEALSAKWKKEPPQDNKLLEAWSTTQEIMSQLDNLEKAAKPFAQLSPISLADAVSAVQSVTVHLATLNATVIAEAQQQLTAINQVSQAVLTARPEAGILLNMIVGFGPQVKAAEEPLQRAQQPLKYAQSTGSLNEAALQNAIEQLAKVLKDLDENVGHLEVGQLDDDAVQAVLLGTIQKGLKSIDDALGDSTKDIAGLWTQIRVGYNSQDRFVRIGRGILDTKQLVDKHLPNATPEQSEKLASAASQLIRAYQYLVNAQVLEAELALERARDLVYQALRSHLVQQAVTAIPLGKLAIDLLTTQLRPSFEGAAWLGDEGENREAALHLPMWLSSLIVRWVPVGLVLLLCILAIGASALVVGFIVYQGIHALFSQQTLAQLDMLSYVIVGLLAFTAFVVILRPTWQLLKRWWSAIWLIFKAAGETAALKAVHSIAWIGSVLVSLTIAVTIIVAAREATLKDSLSTWGTNLDMLVAFTWGAVAHRLLQGLQSNWSGVQGYIEGEKKAEEPAKPAEGK